MKAKKDTTISAHIGSFILPFTVTLVVPFLLTRFFAYGVMPEWVWLTASVGAVVGAVGLTLLATTIRLFHIHGKGTLAPWRPTRRLVVQGPYRYTRNPMISGVLMILVGEALLLQSWAIVVWAALFYTCNTLFFIFVEEPYLLRKHGAQYANYKRRVNRWLPLRKPY